MKEGAGLVLGPLILGAFLALPNAVAVWRALKARGWARTDGRILDSALDVGISGSAEDMSEHLTPRVRYSFRVAGAEHIGGRIGFSGFGSIEARWLTQHSVPGQRVDVWYDPNDPTHAVLQRYPSLSAVVQLTTGVVLLAIAVPRLSQIL